MFSVLESIYIGTIAIFNWIQPGEEQIRACQQVKCNVVTAYWHKTTSHQTQSCHQFKKAYNYTWERLILPHHNQISYLHTYIQDKRFYTNLIATTKALWWTRDCKLLSDTCELAIASLALVRNLFSQFEFSNNTNWKHGTQKCIT